MTFEKLDEDYEYSIWKEHIKTTIRYVEMLDEWIVTVLEHLWSEENRGGNKQNNFIAKLRNFLPKEMGKIIESSDMIVEERQSEDLVI